MKHFLKYVHPPHFIGESYMAIKRNGMPRISIDWLSGSTEVMTNVSPTTQEAETLARGTQQRML